MLTLVDAGEADKRCSTEQEGVENAPASRMSHVELARENGGRGEGGARVPRRERREHRVGKTKAGLELIGVTGRRERAFTAHDALGDGCEPAAHQNGANDLTSGVRHGTALRGSPEHVKRG